MIDFGAYGRSGAVPTHKSQSSVGAALARRRTRAGQAVGLDGAPAG